MYNTLKTWERLENLLHQLSDNHDPFLENNIDANDKKPLYVMHCQQWRNNNKGGDWLAPLRK